MLKRAFDIVFSSAALVVLSPLMAATALGVRVFLGRPVIFRQTRYGRHKKPFEILKFRSLTNARDPLGVYLSDAERLTRFGRLLRLSKLDELPQFINILRGDMSVVGPRARIDLNTDMQGAKKYDVRPGLTGPTQIAKLPITGQEANLLNAAYVDGQKKRGALCRDFAIVAMTPIAVIRNNIQKRYDYAIPRLPLRSKPPANNKM